MLAAVDAGPGRSVVVGHSAACTLVWMAADARPERVAKVVLIGGVPAVDGDTYADFFEVDAGVVPFPGWEPFDGADAADLDEQARRDFAAAAGVGTIVLACVSDSMSRPIPTTRVGWPPRSAGCGWPSSVTSARRWR